jgi:XTP/dITP diphosphohydrolase
LPDSSERRLAIATGNPGKLAEYEDLLAGLGWVLIPCDTGVAETGATYEANARLKAEAAAAASGLPALGDDSGLEVEGLGGFPGLHSARVAPTQPERLAILAQRLAGQPRPWRARFVCWVALAVPGRPTRTFAGEVEGEIVPEPVGEGGFGYDPVFLVPELGQTYAQMGREAKHRFSHRTRAVRRLIDSGALTEPL